MMLELACGQNLWLIGDPHLGKRFENGVPLDRRGEREARQFEKFLAELDADCDINIMVGDLFDHPQVAMSTILAAAEAYQFASERRPQTQFFVMAGNHDRSRQLNTIGAWEIFRKMVVGRYDNVFVVDTVGKVETIAFVPWEWGKPVAEAIDERFTTHHENVEVELVVLHHDLESFGGNTDYMVPAKLIMERFPNCQKIITGHWHLEGDYVVDGVPVACTGSLEPYTHAEDPDGELYVSLTLEQLQARDPADLKDKCVRVFLRDGEELPVGLDCLQLTGKRIADIGADPDTDIVERMGAFDWQAILDEHLKAVEPYVREFIDERLIHAS